MTTVKNQRQHCPNCDRQTLKRPYNADYVTCLSCNKTYDVEA